MPLQRRLIPSDVKLLSALTQYSVPEAELSWKGGNTPFSEQFQDVYYPQEGGLEQARAVFLEGNDIPQRLSAPPRSGSSYLQIGELGFGVGLNFLLVLLAQKRAGARRKLFYFSTEAHPATAHEIERALTTFPELREESTALLKRWPCSLAGNHRIILPEYDAVLDLFFGDALLGLAEMEPKVDAWFLDGFDPRKNDSLWNEPLMEAVARCSHGDTTFATYSAAGWVRRMLEGVGGHVTKVPGPGRKRETIRGNFSPRHPSSRRNLQGVIPERVTVVGAGFAGGVLASTFASRGVAVDLIERESQPCTKASGNARGVILPYITRKPSLQSFLYLSAYLFSIQFLKELREHSLFQQTGIIHFPSTDRLRGLLERLPELALPEAIGRRIGRDELSERLHTQATSDAFCYPSGGWISPRAVVQSLLRSAADQISLRTERTLSQDQSEALQRESPLFLATAYETTQLSGSPDLPLEPVRGQVTHVKSTTLSQHFREVLCYDGYLLPEHGGRHLIGASYDHGSLDEAVRSEEDRELLQKPKQWLPELEFSAETLSSSRVGFRTSTRDRLPMVGKIGEEGAELFVGFGSRGFTSIPLLAEHLVSVTRGEPSPLPHSLRNAIAADRFRRRREAQHQSAAHNSN
ncbi:FAD-dependent 5-carboxymethylaminomethyl-2-thiouridine(34) oxidoreductase MnmC [bacterium]|nr:FAD-dependent 5-carboxymethylaminomethyl-2-thiouridine(34) oxidoreductase MnmC [bacterium]